MKKNRTWTTWPKYTCFTNNLLPGPATAPLTNYISDPVYQELIDKEYDSSKSNERVCLDLRASSDYTQEAEKLERNDSKINL